MRGELWKRIAFTVAALLVVRIGITIPLPGINSEVWMRIFRQNAGGVLGEANLLSGGGLRTLSILALSIAPYVSAAVVIQLFTMVSRWLRAIAEGGEAGRSTIELYVRCGTIVLVALQAYGIAIGIERIDGAVTYPPLLFRLSTVLTLMAGTLFLIWLAQQINIRGIGNGITVLLIAGVLAEGPRNLADLIAASRAGLLSDRQVAAMVLLSLAFAVLAVVVERARRRVWVRFAERHVGDRRIEPQSAALAFKLNPGGIVPALVASWILVIVFIVVQLGAGWLGPRDPDDWLTSLAPGHLPWLVLSAVFVITFAFVYTAFLHDPDRFARQLETHGGAIAELAPGIPPADYLDDTLSRLTLLGAVYLAAIVLLPIALAQWLKVPFVVGGTSLLILVCLALDLEAQVRALRSRPR